jgi:hypothetical protein
MNFKDLESRLQELIEVQLTSRIPGAQIESLLIQKLASSIHSATLPSEDDSLLAPTHYTVIVHPDTLVKWRNPELLTVLLDSIETLAREAGFRFIISPSITFSANPDLSPRDAEVVASHWVEPMEDTNATPNDAGNLEDESQIPENAFLIVEGVKVYPLTQSVVNIGRRLDNQLVIDDPRVSRNHAQLRAIKGRFVVFDLNSTGGTFVNGQRASQSVLYPGDVISLAGVTLIFGQDNPPPRPDLKDTAPLPLSSGERPTAFLKDQLPSSKNPEQK